MVPKYKIVPNDVNDARNLTLLPWKYAKKVVTNGILTNCTIGNKGSLTRNKVNRIPTCQIPYLLGCHRPTAVFQWLPIPE